MGIFSWLRQLMDPEQPPRATAVETPPEDPREAYRRRRYPDCDLTPLPGCQQEQFTAAGTSYRKKALEAFGRPNPDYRLDKMQLFRAGYLDQDVRALCFGPVTAQLMQEPENPHDPNAIKIVLDGVHVGYIKAPSCPFVNRLINTGKIRRVQAQIYGGDYRTLTYNGGWLEPGETAEREELHTEVTRHSIGVAVFIDFVPD